MINLKSSSWNPKKLSTMIKNGNAKFDNEIQRASVWNIHQKSLLIHTMLIGMPIPPLYASQENKVIDFLDGKQRSLAIYNFREGNFALRSVPEITLDDGTVTNVNGMKYGDLPEELKDAFDNYTVSIVTMDGITPEESQEVFFRLNNGTSLKTTDKNFAKAVSKDKIIELYCRARDLDTAKFSAMVASSRNKSKTVSKIKDIVLTPLGLRKKRPKNGIVE